MFFNSLFESSYKKYILYFILFILFLFISCVVFWKIKYNLRKDHSCLINNSIKRCTSTPVTETIFVAISNLNDPDILNTISNLYLHAYCPRRIFIGLCDQFKSKTSSSNSSDRSSSSGSSSGSSSIYLLHQFLKISQKEKYYFPIPFESLEAFLNSNIKTYTLCSRNESKGPDYSRAIIMKYLYANQKYILFVHSHTRFMPHWDLQMISQLNQCPNPEKSILTMIPNNIMNASFLLNYDELRKLTDQSVTNYGGILSKQYLLSNIGPYFSEPPNYLCAQYLQNRKLPSYISKKCVTMPIKPVPQLFWSSTFSFSYAEPFVKNVQFDYYLENVFEGNELALSARLWTHGYSFYTPLNMIILHHHYSFLPTDQEYCCELERNFYRHGEKPKINFAQQRIEVLLGMRSLKDIYNPEIIQDLIDVFGLGNTKSFQLYQQFIGISFADYTITDIGASIGLSKNYDIDEYVAKRGFH